jgi:hypothetical protein
MTIIQSRRGFISGLGALFVAAPAIVRASSLMPVKSISVEDFLRYRMEEAYRITRDSISENLYGELTQITCEAFLPGPYVQIYQESLLLAALSYD